MCGRYTLHVPGEEIGRLFELPRAPVLRPRYNIAPTQDVAVVTTGPSAAREMRTMRWGLVPAWADDPAVGSRMINARSETAAEKSSFRSAFRHRRCLIPADGFYEWRKLQRGKQPYHIRLADGGGFAFAGLWESWSGGEGDGILSCTILTAEPNELLREVHNRMPVILAPSDYSLWLSGETDTASLKRLMRAYPADEMVCRPVSKAVNNPAHDAPDCIQPIDA